METKTILKALPMTLAVVVLLMLAALSLGGRMSVGGSAGAGDTPPTVDFTWSPAGAVSLHDMKATLSIHDDHGIDFSSYKMELVEVGKTIDLGDIGKSMLGKDYEQPISFSLIADSPRLVGKEYLTVRISVADDKGQKTEKEYRIMLKP